MNISRRVASLVLGLVASQLAATANAQVPSQPIYYEQQTWFIPRLVVGDGEFNGHGPQFSVIVNLYVHPFAPNEVWAEVTATAAELGGDTFAHEVRHVRVARFAHPVSCIISPTFGQHAYVDTNHDVDTFYNPCPNGLLNAVHYVGDTRGHEAGTRSGVLLEFNPILAY